MSAWGWVAIGLLLAWPAIGCLLGVALCRAGAAEDEQAGR